MSLGRIHIACAAADPAATLEIDPSVDLGEYLCSDCKNELKRVGESVSQWAKAHNDIVIAEKETRIRSPWLWPVWVLLRPVEIVGRPKLAEADDR